MALAGVLNQTYLIIGGGPPTPTPVTTSGHFLPEYTFDRDEKRKAKKKRRKEKLAKQRLEQAAPRQIILRPEQISQLAQAIGLQAKEPISIEHLYRYLTAYLAAEDSLSSLKNHADDIKAEMVLMAELSKQAEAFRLEQIKRFKAEEQKKDEELLLQLIIDDMI